MNTFPGQSKTRSVLLADEASTKEFARQLAVHLTAGDCILFSGDIGAGKSVISREIIQSRMAGTGEVTDVPSPTYTLVQTYEIDGLEFWHSDLYRLGDISEIDELGLDQAFQSAVCLIEWAEKLEELAPRDALSIHLIVSNDADARAAELSWTHARWDSKLSGIANG